MNAKDKKVKNPKSGESNAVQSLAGQEEKKYIYLASFTHEQLMKNMTDMIIAAYGLTPEKLANPGLVNKITIMHYDETNNKFMP